MTEEGGAGLSWENRLSLWLPHPPLFGAFLVAVFFGAVYVGFQSLFDLRVDLSAFGIVLFITLLLMFPRYFFDRLDRQRNGRDESDSDRHQVAVQGLYMPSDAIRISRFAGAGGVVVFAVLWELIQISQGEEPLTLWVRLHNGTASTVLFLLLGWLAGRRLYLTSVAVRNSPGPQESDIDLLDLEDLYAFGRGGLHATLVLYIVLALAGLFILPGVGSGVWVVVPMFTINLGLGLSTLLRPARQVRSLIRAVKREELARLEPLLRQARDETLTGNTPTQGRLTDLLAYKTQVESTPEWPFDSPTLVRFGFYVFIPVVSMIAGAFVERGVDILLD